MCQKCKFGLIQGVKNHSSLIKEDVWLKENEARVFLLKKKNFFSKN